MAKTNKDKQASTNIVTLVDVSVLGKDLPGWKLAGVSVMKNWKPGKQVSQTEFDEAVKQFDSRSIGSGGQ